MRRVAVAFLLSSTALACGLAFSPGDYREATDLGPGSGLDGGGNLGDGGGPGDPGEAGGDAGPPRTRIALFAGRRDAVTGESGDQVAIAETMLTSFGDDGSLGPIAYDAPPPSAQLWTHGALTGGRIYLQTATALASAPFADRVSGPWTAAVIPAPPETGIRGWLLEPSGLLSGRAAAGDNTQAWRASLADGGVGDWMSIGATTTVARGHTTLVRAGEHVYIVGGATPAAGDQGILGHAEVEVAKLGPNGEPGDFVATEPLPKVADGGAFATYEPVAVGSSTHLFLLGGLVTAESTSLTDFACVARVKDPASGALDPWVTLPKLPLPMQAFAAVVTPRWLVVFGGQVATNGGKTRSEVLRLAIRADGTFGTSWETAGALPEGRANLIGVTY